MSYALQDKERFRKYLKEHGLSLSQARDQAFEMIKKWQGSFNAEELIQAIEKQQLGISRATIYRTLSLLKQAQFLHVTGITNRQTRYVYAGGSELQDSFFCMHCKKVVNLQPAS